MRTIHEYEPSDINLRGSPVDPVHSFLMGQFLVFALTGLKSKEGEDSLLGLQRAIADFLNAAQKAGISITKSEVPEVFRR